MPARIIRNKDIPVIDLFAGPGGLSEGFAAYATKSGKVPFNIRASVEMDQYAHQTLELRSFFHEFDRDNVPEEYYQYLRREITREELFTLYPIQAAAAKERAIMAELGVPEDDELIYGRLDKVLKRYENKPWVLVGGPPCQAYSTIGRSRRQIYSKGAEAHEKDHRNFLYKQYLRTIARYRPTVFVMENVKGMLSAKVNGERIFYKILSDLQKPQEALSEVSSVGDSLEYKIYSLVVSKDEGAELDPMDYLIQSELYGVPQARHRVILLGVRSDVGVKPSTLKKHTEKIGVKSVLDDLPALRSSFTRVLDSGKEWYDFIRGITRQPWFEDYKPAVAGSNSVDSHDFNKKMSEFLESVKGDLEKGSEYLEANHKTSYKPEWYNDTRLGGVLNHEARGHMKEDLYRYFFASAFAAVYGRSPRMKDFPKELLPKHKNVADALAKGSFDDRFRVQEAARPAVTITCHIAKDGHYSIHYDPTQCRSLTVREAARLQSFPDNYYFVGPRSQQYKQVGNAVPPLLANQIAEIVYDVLAKIPSLESTITQTKTLTAPKSITRPAPELINAAR